ncbi:GGDEF domain-containing protein [Enterobacter sp. R1(2018)]|uniref:GGDEF domain-containing protein n=1 Tax=Enterobacter sp. R1(2018) TaxID=2447891 RepID=UPI00217CE710|nr:GGDEF domain-containing protein [Enterobacter sp. R1(2018)]
MSDRRKACPDFDLRLSMIRQHAINVSGTWFLWVNILFSAFILGRNYFSPQSLAAVPHHPRHLLEISMVLVLAISAGVIFILRMAPDQQAPWLSKLTHRTMMCLSGLWALSFYVFIASGDVRIVFPFSALLIFTALISLYFDGRVLLSFTLPIWTVILICNFVYPSTLSALNALLYVLMAALFESGRRILRSWFVLAIRREQENVDLINQLKLLANRDPLTGIANRRSFQLLLDKEIQRQQQTNAELALIMLDVDHFKKYNDSYGHQAGDECLRNVARCLESATRNGQDIVARFGGEEFIMLLPDTSRQQAVAIAERVKMNLQELGMEHKSSPVAPFVTVSQGIASDVQGTSAIRLIAEADAALYQAKNAGRNRWQYYAG